MMPPRIGELRRRINVEVENTTPDGAGGSVRTWVPAMTVFGRIEPVRRREDVRAGSRMGVVTHRVTIRRPPELMSTLRLVVDAVIYRVLAVECADPRRRFVDLLCEEEQA